MTPFLSTQNANGPATAHAGCEAFSAVPPSSAMTLAVFGAPSAFAIAIDAPALSNAIAIGPVNESGAAVVAHPSFAGGDGGGGGTYASRGAALAVVSGVTDATSTFVAMGVGSRFAGGVRLHAAKTMNRASHHERFT